MIDIKVCPSDTTKCRVDVIVSPINPDLVTFKGRGCVSVHEKAGPEMLEELKKIKKTKYPKGLPVSSTVTTKAYKLNAKYVVHVVCPMYDPKIDQSKLLYKCFVNVLRAAERKKARTISIPAISTGAYKYPKLECAKIAKDVFDNYKFKTIEQVRICLFKPTDYKIFQKVFSPFPK